MINNDFFKRSADVVARELLGKLLVRRIGNKELKSRIVETEAYFDENDPASRACQNGDLRETMKMDPGTILVYGVHNNWLVNIVTDNKGTASAVLLRAVEPLNFDGKGNGPGLLTRSLCIDKQHHKKMLGEEIVILDKDSDIEELKESDIIESSRIGVKEDLEQPLRFFIKDNEHVSTNKVSRFVINKKSIKESKKISKNARPVKKKKTSKKKARVVKKKSFLKR